MFSKLAFLITALEVAIVAGGFFLESQHIVYTALIYGSPFYIVMTILGPDSVLSSGNPIFLALFAFHILKYFIIFRAQISDAPNMLRYLAIGLEGIYLVVSGYYIN